MVYIPAGSFMMGDADTASNGAQPPHMVTLSAYCMDLTEVTVRAYRGCTAPECTTPNEGRVFEATGSHVPLIGNPYNAALRYDHPINGVWWSQSRAYCQWRGGDLPTEAQWEYAARGSDVANHIYPWGNAAPASQLCWSGVTVRDTTCPPQSYPLGNSPFGLFDMAGNVEEWTLDFYGIYPAATAMDPTGPTSGRDRVVRGGSWISRAAADVRAARRVGVYPAIGYPGIGFRCVRPPM
jgi:formylglycine-generating enzyme required for sulfatase activity